jgi:plasmid maintenance system antidote protein VapI
MDKKQKDIARKHEVSESTVSLLVNGKRYTKDVKLAMQIAKAFGTNAIDYINPKFRALYTRAYPRLKT